MGSLGFTFAQTGNITLTIDGKEYTGAVDGPAFVDFWRANSDKLGTLADESNPDMGKDAVAFCVGLVTALLGADACREIFDGKQVSLIDCVGFVGYIMGQIGEQGMEAKLLEAMRKYGKADVLL